MTAPPANSDYELLTEHLGYPPVALIDDIINTVNVLADRALDSVERLLLSIPPQKLGFSSSSQGAGKKSKKGRSNATVDDNDQQQQLAPEEAAKREIENGTHQLETLLNASIDKNFDLFELYTMRNILSVRPNDQPYMRLAHYDGLDFGGATTAQQQRGHAPHVQPGGGGEGAVDPDRPTPASVTALRRKLQASQRLQAALEAERARNDVLLRRLRTVLGVRGDADDNDGDAEVKREDGTAQQQEGEGSSLSSSSRAPLKFLGEKGTLEDGGTDQPITTTAEFALSQLQALRALSTSLRTLQPDLGTLEDGNDAADATDDNDNEDGRGNNNNKTWRRQRAEYIEASSREYLERAGGLELGPRGEVRDGDWQGQGRGLGRDEVEGLERAAAALAAASGDAAGGGGGEDDDGGRRRPPASMSQGVAAAASEDAMDES
ncbi:hypothetical protein JDV02_002749 [Purpureocillium takamizusanense]|uniref:Kinetochore-associated protein MTW1 n=1 Tax=Purpureocillium takamizusanense TaxID=2060973 RepID=A0A9Q8QCA0_9HYPO|nr:uncharacterized protein JDV02_002749 [Purpureocillium takamizusanense]UNI16306.1 hypothetical protein JDV02_002749 [Purpureocillium takamizusanense]